MNLVTRFSFLYSRVKLTSYALALTIPLIIPLSAASESIRFAVIGDYGLAGADELDVANLVKGWNPDFIITTGDNNYPSGAAATIDDNIGQYYNEFIYPYTGTYGAGADTNRFFPSLGNHDWNTPNAQPYLDYFTLPGNERYYDFTWGPAHFFAIDSDTNEPDGTSSGSTQATWLQGQLAASSAQWKLVYLHHAPYSSSSVHGSTIGMQWPYEQWGATAVLAGHDHIYERIINDGFPYFVNGLGGSDRYGFGAPIPGSEVRYNGDDGAMKVDADTDSITFQFINRSGTTIDTYTINAPTPTPTSTPTVTPTPTPNYVNLEVEPITVSGGGKLTASRSCDFSIYNYQGIPVDIYLAAIQNPVVSDAPSSVSDALAGGIVYLFGPNMASGYVYTGSVGEPTFSNVAFPPAPLSGSLTITIPLVVGYAGDYVLATVFIRHDTRAFICDDGLPVENSNLFTVH